MKRVLSVIFLFLSLTALSQTSEFTFNQGGTSQTSYYSVIPFESVKGKIIVNVAINSKSYRFIVDTGAPTTISEKLYRELSSTIIHSALVTDQSGKQDSMQVVNLAEITLGNVMFNNVPTLVGSQTFFLFDCLQVDGFIGSNMLRNSIVQLSYPAKIMTLTDDLKRLNLRQKKYSKLVFKGVQSSPQFLMKLEGRDKQKANSLVLFDTGMEGLFDLSINDYSLFASKNIFQNSEGALGSSSEGFFGIAEDAKMYKFQVPIMDVNGFEMRNVSTETTQANGSRVGSKILEYAAVTIDYQKGRLYVDPLVENGVDVYEKTFPVSPTPRNGKVYIGIVWDSALVDRVKSGDQVIAIDGVDYENINICDLITKDSIFKTRDRIMLTTRDAAGGIHSIAIERR